MANGNVIDLRDQGELRKTGGDLAGLFQGLASRIDPEGDSFFRKILFPISREEEIALEMKRQFPASEAVQAATREQRAGNALEDELPLTERATIDATTKRAELPASQLKGAEAQRGLDILKQLNKVLPAEEVAKIQATALRAEGSKAKLEGETAERQLDVISIAESMGWTARDDAELAVLEGTSAILKAQIESMGLQLDEAGMRQFAEIYVNANPTERRIITTGLVGDRGALFGQYLLQQERIDLDLAKSRLAASGDPMERLENELLLKIQLREERDRLIGELNSDDVSSDRRATLIADINSLAEDMIRVDPAMLATIARADLGTFGGVKGAEFDLTSLVKENADQILINAHIVEQEGFSANAINQLREAYRDPRTGRVNERAVEAIVNLADKIHQDRINRVTFPPPAREQFTLEDGPALKAQLDTALRTGIPAPEISSLVQQIEKWERWNYIYNTLDMRR